jgi:hypothetical protein
MTETQAKSGGTGTSTTPVDEEPAEGGAAATGRAAVGRAVVPADAPSPPKFTRAPGMAPPPGEPPADEGPSEAERPAAGNAKATATASVPIVTKGSKTGGQNPKVAPPPAKGGGPAPKGGSAAQGGSAAPTGAAAQQSATRSGQAARTGVIPAAKPGSAPSRPGSPGAPSRPAGPGEAGKRPGAGAASGSAAVGAARVGEAVRSARSTVSSAAARGPRRARLNLKRIDPWSVMKFSFAVSVVLFIVVVVATSVLYLALDAMGVWTEVNQSLTELVNAGGGAAADSTTGGFKITAWGVIGTSMLIGAVNVVLFTALATLGAFIYNVCADLVGGIELTLAERD